MWPNPSSPFCRPPFLHCGSWTRSQFSPLQAPFILRCPFKKTHSVSARRGIVLNPYVSSIKNTTAVRMANMREIVLPIICPLNVSFLVSRVIWRLWKFFLLYSIYGGWTAGLSRDLWMFFLLSIPSVAGGQQGYLKIAKCFPIVFHLWQVDSRVILRFVNFFFIVLRLR